MSAIRVDVMASAVGKIGGVTWHHLFLVATETSGRHSYLRAGPEQLPIQRLAGRRNAHGDALRGFVPSPAGPYGIITFSSGPYEPGGTDFDPAAANAPLASGESAGQVWSKLQAAALALQAENIPYDPVGKGANWALAEVLRRCGLNPTLPPKRWAPGAFLLPPNLALETVSARRLGEAVIA